MDGPAHVPVDTAKAPPPRSILKKRDSHDCSSIHTKCTVRDDNGGSTDADKIRGAQWDEMNILATYHPVGKDYGHMKIDDPPTPYHEYVQELVDDAVDGNVSACSVSACSVSSSSPNPLRERKASFSDTTPEMLDSEVLAGKLAEPYKPRGSRSGASSDSEDERLNEEEQAKHKLFEDKRKQHYNEFQAVQRARQLLQDEEDEEEKEGEAEAME